MNLERGNAGQIIPVGKPKSSLSANKIYVIPTTSSYGVNIDHVTHARSVRRSVGRGEERGESSGPGTGLSKKAETWRWSYRGYSHLAWGGGRGLTGCLRLAELLGQGFTHQMDLTTIRAMTLLDRGLLESAWTFGGVSRVIAAGLSPMPVR